jgi:uncharacterized membrane protein
MARKAFWWLMMLLALLVSAYALALVFLPAARPPFVRERFAWAPLATYAHLLGGAVALAVGPFQFSTKLRARWLGLHRLLGRVYVVGILSSGIGGFVIAFVSQGGVPAHFGLGCLALLWLITGAVSYRRAVTGNVARHREWMIRNYSLTLAAVTRRIYIPLSVIAGIPFEYAYPAITWLCWVPNLLIAEWMVMRGTRRSPLVKESASTAA